MKNRIFYIVCCLFLGVATAQTSPREVMSLNEEWETVFWEDALKPEDAVFKETGKQVNIPHNWDQYYGYRRGKHGNLHGNAWYRRKLSITKKEAKQYYLFFEGVGSYATVWVNGIEVGSHKGGRTTFTINITKAIKSSGVNEVLVKAAHPAFIADLPWVCGGCSGEWGFSEGSQPLGIFRPVSLIVTNNLKIAPFGVHAWLQNTFSTEKALLKATVNFQNNAGKKKKVSIVQTLQDREGNIVAITSSIVKITKDSLQNVTQELPQIKNPHLWSPNDPYLYTLITEIRENNKVIDSVSMPYGIRWVSWPQNRTDEDQRVLINNKPYFINGTCEYEHLMGNSHSFSKDQIAARIRQLKVAGFNAFREGHQPHNLYYQELLDKEGIMFWSQFSAHIWYDTPEFKENFKQLLKEWILERRNSPSIILWGLQNESTLPKAFAEECTKIIREMDPTASQDRLVTTCNGGEGTDWNVIQNWSGTYGGDPYNYGNELKTDLLNGEYGAWRIADVHTEGDFDQKGALSEDRFAQLMEIKVREAERVKDSVVGQFNWLMVSHENPGRIQNGEGYRDLDRVGPVNYKGLFTIWGEPLDAYYMYAGNYASKETNPMVYIVSHSWPNRFVDGNEDKTISVYSNCDEVELFNDVNGSSLGMLKNPGIGQHFEWKNVNIKYNTLYAKGYVNGKKVAEDIVIFNDLPTAPHFNELKRSKQEVLQPEKGKNYLYRINAGGPAYVDSFGNTWQADRQQTEKNEWGSESWTSNFEKLPPFYGSQRRTFEPVQQTENWELFQTFRYGTDQLLYHFPLENGEYTVELFFAEPWYGLGTTTDVSGYRKFDIALNGTVVEKDLDIYNEAGFSTALKKTYKAQVENGVLTISFPHVKVGQAVISAIAISGKSQTIQPVTTQYIQQLKSNQQVNIKTWLDVCQLQFTDNLISWTALPYEVFGGEWLQFNKSVFTTDFSGSFTVGEDVLLYAFIDGKDILKSPFDGFQKIEGIAKNSAGRHFSVFSKELKKGEVFHFQQLDQQLEFTFVARPIYEMGEEEADRPILELQAEDAITEGAFIKDFYRKEDFVEFTGAGSIEWEAQTGLAGIHLLRFSYMNSSGGPLKATIQLIAPNGALLKNDEITFPEQPKKWKILNTTTGGYINAGTYKIRLLGEGLEGLRIDALEFQ